jgi:hypothetical protein
MMVLEIEKRHKMTSPSVLCYPGPHAGVSCVCDAAAIQLHGAFARLNFPVETASLPLEQRAA